MIEFKRALLNYVANIIIIWLAIVVYFYNPYYIGFLGAETYTTLMVLALAYTILALPAYLIFNVKESKGYIIFKVLWRVIREGRDYLKNMTTNPESKLPKIDMHEKSTMLFAVVKFFFLPIMINFFFNNYHAVMSYIGTVSNPSFSLTVGSYLSIIFPFAIAAIFLLDTFIFSLGYAFESGFLKNKLRSVEPTFFGWAVALICYPPFNGLYSNFVTWHADNMIDFGTITANMILRTLILLLLVVYVWATVALGTKSSNLTNRGIVTKGPYRFIRHPAYISKNLTWWITILPIMTLPIFLGMLSWSVIYYFRAITEERHLLKDPDYAEYCKKVKYRFIPGVW